MPDCTRASYVDASQTWQHLLTVLQQGGSSTNEPTQAIQAAINQDVSLLLGIWASGGDGVIQAEITAIKAAIAQHGTDFTNLVAGMRI